MLLSQCDDTCGWLAAVMSALCFGTYGVPLKSKSTMKTKCDPLVIQTYQTVVFFIICWSVLLAGIELKWTMWGLASGLFWVPGSTLGIYAVRNAGLAISVGIWSSMIIIVSFFWGIVIFHEKVKSVQGACGAVCFLIIGLVGMSIYSSPKSGKILPNRKVENDEDVDITIEECPSQNHALAHSTKKRILVSSQDLPNIDAAKVPFEIEPLVHKAENETKPLDISKRSNTNPVAHNRLGIACAIFNGVWGGSNLIPLHFARNDGITGLEYTVSFGCGSMVVLCVMWIVRFLYNLALTWSTSEAYHSLPCFHVRRMCWPSALAGAFFSVGKIFSIIAVLFLGQGVGYSLTQTQVLVSGLWGIYYYEEISDKAMIRGWFASAGITVAGILWLSYEHESDH